ncbi:MAG: hypothetical protein ACRCSN_17940 [Dermatophilaceae bacterium]
MPTISIQRRPEPLDAAPGPLAHHDFRALVAGTTVSALGNAISPVALAFAVLDLGGSLTRRVMPKAQAVAATRKADARRGLRLAHWNARLSPASGGPTAGIDTSGA